MRRDGLGNSSRSMDNSDREDPDGAEKCLLSFTVSWNLMWQEARCFLLPRECCLASLEAVH